MTDDLGVPPTRLLTALARGDHDAALEAIRAGDDVNVRDPRYLIGDQTTALHLAALNGDCLVVSELIRHGADVNVQTGSGETPLWFACNCGHYDVIRELLDNGADHTITNNHGYTPRHRIRASDSRTISMFDELIAPHPR